MFALCRIRSYTLLASLLLLCASLAACGPACAEDGYYAPTGALDTPGYAAGVATAGNYAYIADTTALRIIDVSDPSAPAEVGHYDGLTEALDVAVSGNYAYVVDGTNGLWSFNVSNPSNPVQVGHLGTTSQAQTFLAKSIALKGSYALVGTYAQGTRFVSIANPATPVEVALKYGPLWGTDVAVDGDHAYVADLYGNTWLYDVLDPTDPQEIIQWSFGGTGTYGVAAAGAWVYVSDSNALYAMYAPDPMHPSTGGYVAGACGRVEVANGYAYVAWDLLSHPNGGLEVLDQSTPTDPIFGWWDTDGQSEDVDVANGYVYLADGDAGLVIFPQASPGAISGVVRVAGTTTGIAGATVEASVGAVVKGSATTAANGSYAIAGVRPGLYTVTARKQDYIAQTKTGVSVEIGQSVGVNFNLGPAGVLTGQVKDKASGYVIAQAAVAVYVGGVVKATTTADWNGIYRFPELLPGTYVATASKTGYITQTKANISVTQGATSYANFNLDPVCLKGQVKQAGTTINIEGATVSAYLGDELKATTTTNASGIYEIGGLASGTYKVMASKPGYMRQTKWDIAVTAGATTYVNFALNPSGTLKGQIKDAGANAPLPGAAVDVFDYGNVWTSGASTAPYGIYEINQDLAAKSYLVRASKSGYVRQYKFDVAITPGLTTFLNFSLQPSGKLKGQVKDKVSGAPIAGATVIARSGGVIWATGTTTAPWGIYEVDSDLPAGTYVVGASKAGYLGQTRKDIPVAVGATAYVNFNLAPGG